MFFLFYFGFSLISQQVLALRWPKVQEDEEDEREEDLILRDTEEIRG